jgi:hypothetical protein
MTARSVRAPTLTVEAVRYAALSHPTTRTRDLDQGEGRDRA